MFNSSYIGFILLIDVLVFFCEYFQFMSVLRVLVRVGQSGRREHACELVKAALFLGVWYGFYAQ